MSTRERWIVYPLLFLALGTALRPKLAPTFEASIMQVTSDEVKSRELTANRVTSDDVKSRKLTADRVTCRSLTIVDGQKRPRIELVVHAHTGDGEVRLVNNDGVPVVSLQSDAQTRAGLIETRSNDGRAQTALWSTESGGEVVAFDRGPTQTISIGHRDGRAGLIETNLKTGQAVLKPVGE
jgi:hypothetical protein